MRANTSATVVVLAVMQHARWTLARSPPGTTVGGWSLIPHLKPVGHQSTNWMVRLVLMVAMAALTSLGTTSPRYIMQQAMYLPWRGSHLVIMLAGSKHELVISATGRDSWYAFSAEMIGEYEDTMKWMRGYGTRLVWNSVRSTLRAPSKRSGQRGDHLSHETVQVGVGRALDVEAATADVVQGLVVKHDSDIGVLEEGVGGEHGVVGLDHSGGDLGGGVAAEGQLGLLAVVHGETLQKEGAEARASTSTDGVEHHEALEASALVGELTEAVEGEVHDLLTHGVVATGIVVGSILLTGDKLLGVVELTVGTGADLVDHSGLEVEVDAAGHVLASTSLGEEGVEGVIATTDGLVGGHLAIRLDTVLEAVQLPAAVTDLATALTAMNGDGFTHV